MLHLLVDNQLIEVVQDLTRVVHRPQKMGHPLLVADQPWEHIPYFGNYTWSILRDSETGIFRCWYEDWILDAKGLADNQMDITHPSVSKSRLCYAISKDGRQWEKPELNLIREGGLDTNIVLGDSKDDPELFGNVHAATILDDPLERDKSRRFKMLFQHIRLDAAMEDSTSMGQGAPQILQSPIRAAYSPDGIHWEIEETELDFGGLGPKLGDVLVLSCDVKQSEYVLNTRHPNAWKVSLNPKLPRTAAWSMPYYPGDSMRLNKRRVFRTASRDFIHWEKLELIMTSDDEEDNLDDSFYGLVSWSVGDLQLGLLGVFQSVDNVITPHLVYSRDGKKWQRTNRRQPILSLGHPETWDEFMTVTPCPPIRIGDEWWLYYGGSNVHHDWWITGAREGLTLPEAQDLELIRQGIGLARLRLNGFVSLRAGSVREGLLVTRPVAVDGRYLEINAQCRPGGYIQVELSDSEDGVLPGYTRSDSHPFTGDAVAHRCRWDRRVELIQPRSLKLRFWLKDADLFSFQWMS